TLLLAYFVNDLIGPQPRLARSTIDHRIAESVLVTARFPNRAVHQDRAVHADDVVAFVGHDAPPIIFQITLQLDAERSVIPETIQPAVDFARLKNETAPLAQADDLFHPCRAGTRRRRALHVGGHAH